MGARTTANLDIFWLRDESLEDADSLPSPDVLAAEIAEDLEAALAEFAEIASSLAPSASTVVITRSRSAAGWGR